MNPSPPTINTPLKSRDLMQNTSPFFNNPLTHRAIKLPRIKIFKTGFRKLLVFRNSGNDAYGSGWGGRGSFLRHYDAYLTKIDM